MKRHIFIFLCIMGLSETYRAHAISTPSQDILNKINIKLRNLNSKVSHISTVSPSLESSQQLVKEFFTGSLDKQPVAEKILHEILRAVFYMLREAPERDILKSTTAEHLNLRPMTHRNIGSVSNTNLSQAQKTLVAYSADLMKIIKVIETFTPAQQLALNVNYIRALYNQAVCLYKLLGETITSN